MRGKVSIFCAALTVVILFAAECIADDPRAAVVREREQSTISISLEFAKKHRGPVLRALSSLGAVTPNASASGFYVGEGLVMTSYHVVSGQLSEAKKKKLGFKAEDELEVRAFVNGCQAKTVKVDPVSDLALLRICSQSKPARKATFGGSPSTGEQLLLIAQPGDYKMIRRGSFKGTYSFGGYEYLSIRIDGQDGFSGSPVYDSKGEIVGVFCRYDWKQGLALISPASQAQKLITEYDAGGGQSDQR